MNWRASFAWVERRSTADCASEESLRSVWESVSYCHVRLSLDGLNQPVNARCNASGRMTIRREVFASSIANDSPQYLRSLKEHPHKSPHSRAGKGILQGFGSPYVYEKFGSSGRIRTYNPSVNSRLTGCVFNCLHRYDELRRPALSC